MKHSIFFIIGAAMLLTTASCHVETLEPLRPDAVQSAPYAGQLAFRADLSCGPATRSDYDTFEVEQPSTGKKVDVEVFLRPMAGGTMSGICDAPAEPFMETGDVDYEVADAARFAETRSAPVESMYTSFRFVAPPYGEKTATRTSSGYYSVDNLRYSDFEDPAVFFCWAPGNAQGVSYDVATGHLSYVASSDVTFQPDLVAARSAAIPPDNDQPVELTFRHLLAGIQVKTASIFPGCTVNHVTLKNVCKQGTYDPETATWTADTETLMDLELLPAARPNVTTDYMLADGAYTAMVVPQVLPAGAELEISLVFRGKTFDYSYPLSGWELNAGTLLELSLDGRSMYSFEGTATGAFNVYMPIGNSWNGREVLATVTLEDIDEDGRFSILVPFPYLGRICFGYNVQSNVYVVPAANRNQVLTTITKYPDYIETLTALQSLFEGCAALTSVPDMPWTGNVTNMNKMFGTCLALEEIPELNTDSATMFVGMFGYCSQITEAPFVDTSRATNTAYMYIGCTSLVTIPLLDTSHVTNFDSMFQSCSSLTSIPALDMSSGTSFQKTFLSCSSLATVPPLDLSNATNLWLFMNGCRSLTSLELTSTAKVGNFGQAFQDCVSLVTAPGGLSFENATTCGGAFKNCTSLVSFPSCSFPKCTNFDSMFNNCSSLETVGVMDTPKANILNAIFNNCVKLVSSPLRNISTATSCTGMFAGTTALRDFTPLDFSSATTIQSLFYKSGIGALPYLNTLSCSANNCFSNVCYASSVRTIEGLDLSSYTKTIFSADLNIGLQYIGRLDNVKCNLQLTYSTITHESLVSIIDHLDDMTANPKTFYLGTANYAKMSADEIAAAAAKGWTLTSDHLTNVNNGG